MAAAKDWDFIQWDMASEALDPHAVGVAIKPLQGPPGGVNDDFSVDKGAFEQVLKQRKGGKGGAQKQGFGRKS